MKNCFLLIVILTLLVFSANLSVQNAGPVRDIPVTSVIYNNDSNGIPYRIQSDSLGSYKNGVGSVVSIVQGIGNWELDLLNSTTRKIFVDLGDPVPNSNPNHTPFTATMSTASGASATCQVSCGP